MQSPSPEVAEEAPSWSIGIHDEVNPKDDAPMGDENYDVNVENNNLPAPAHPEYIPAQPPPPPVPFDRATHIDHHPDPTAGAVLRWVIPVEGRTSYGLILEDEQIFEVAHWLANQPITDAARDAFLRMARDLPWKNVQQFNASIDSLPHGPGWYRKTIRVKGDAGEVALDLWMRNSLHIVRHLISNTGFRRFMRFAPVREWTSALRDARIYSEMWSGDWWWRIQSLLGKGATVCPIIIGSDQTQMTVLSGDKKAWPVYLSIGNISKRLRKRSSQGASLLVGYIPVDNLDCITNKEQRRYARWQLFHKCMEAILEPIRQVSRQGEEMCCADGGVRRVHPILAAFMGDYPEQCLVTCTRDKRCPICLVPRDKKADFNNEYPRRTKQQMLDALSDYEHGHTATIDALGIRPTRPFWEKMPFVDIFKCVAPDLLHQVDKGVFGDHLVDWGRHVLGKEELDRRLKGMPRYPGLRHFTRGISIIRQWTGNEAKALSRVFLPALGGCRKADVIRAVRGIVDFMFRAHLPELSSEDLDDMESDLAAFHDAREVFRVTGALKTDEMFDGIPKLHMLSHYTDFIRELGTPDGYNSEITERLHIDCVKKAWRASNKVNATQQMARHLQRREGWAIFCAHMHEIGRLPASLRRQYESLGSEEVEVEGNAENATVVEGDKEEGEDNEEYEDVTDDARGSANGQEWNYSPRIGLAKRATLGTKPTPYLIRNQGMVKVLEGTRKFMLTLSANNDLLPLNLKSKFPLWTRFRLHHERLPFLPSLDPHTDHVRAFPAKEDEEGRVTRYEGFDCVLYLDDSDREGLHRYRVGRIRGIFKLPREISYVYDHPLAYVENFRPFSPNPLDPHQLYTTSHEMDGNERSISVIPLSSIRGTCHLVPQYHLMDDRDDPQPLSPTDDLLSLSRKFYLSRHNSHFMFAIMNYWRRNRQARP